ncbi:DUF6146 family protein [Flavobacteriaceae bacterium]|nr:DUF6146 family protein [Flavobacteriaceae bacterium]
MKSQLIIGNSHSKKLFIKAFLICLLTLIVTTCKTNQIQTSNSVETAVAAQDTIKISHDSLTYDIMIIEPGFGSWLERMAKPSGYYSLEFLEGRNQVYVSEWNRRVLQSSAQYAHLYEMQINYNVHLKYGYEVNYKLYNYFIYFQLRHEQQLSGILPKI